MSCNLLDIEMADIDLIKELAVFIGGKVQGYSIRPPEKNKPTKQELGVFAKEFCETVDVWITVTFPTFFPDI